MKKQTNYNFAKYLLALGMLVICAFSVVSVISPDAADALVAFIGLSGSGVSGFMVANTIIPVNTFESTNAARGRTADDPGFLVDDISSFVTEIKPDDFALDSLLRSMESTEKAENIIVNFEEVVFRGSEDTITTALVAPTGVTDADKFRNIVVGNPDLWVKGETIYVPSVLVSGKPLQLRLEKINTDNTLQVTGINTADNVVPAIPLNTELKRGATAYGELRAKAENKTILPDPRFNYCQRFMAQVDEGFIRGQIKSKTGFGAKDQNFIRMYDMRTEAEKSSIFGTRGKVWSKEENEWVYYQEGIFHQLTNGITYTGATGITNNQWIDWTKQLFAGNSGADDRVFFAGADLMANILKIPAVEKQQSEDRVELIPGMKIMKVETSFGILYLKYHKLFDIMGHKDDGLVVDMTNIKKRSFAALSQRDLKLREAGISNMNATLIEEMFCLETRYLETHATIKKVG